GFRADTGFVPQVGYRETYAQAGWQVYPKGFLSRERTFINVDYQAEPSGAVITRDVEPGASMDTRWSGFLQFRYVDNRTRAGDRVIERHQFGYYAQFSPSRRLSFVNINGTLGQDIDFENSRPARGSTINASATVQPSDHLAVDLIENTRWLNVDGAQGADARLFLQRISRIKATYTFTSRLLARAILLPFAAPAAAQDEDALRASFEGKRVTLRIDLPGSSDGVNVHAEGGRGLDYDHYRNELKRYGTALHAGESATVTLVKV